MREALLVLLSGCQLIFDAKEQVDSGQIEDIGDEDNDQLTNDEDLCPGIPSEQKDGDGDGVGDECDRSRDEPGDRIVSKYFFNDPESDQAEWTVGPGWVFQDGFVATDRTPTSLVAMLAPAGGAVRVEIGFSVTAFGALGNGTGLELDGSAKCIVLDEVPNSSSALRLDFAPQISGNIPITPEIVPNEPLRMFADLDRTTGEFACLGAGVMGFLTSNPTIPAEFSIISTDNGAAVRYVVVYTRP